MPLTDRQIKNTKPAAKAYKLTDGSGLYLQVIPAGGKLWRFDYAIANKRKTLSIGKYPLIRPAEQVEMGGREIVLKITAKAIVDGYLYRQSETQ